MKLSDDNPPSDYQKAKAEDRRNAALVVFAVYVLVAGFAFFAVSCASVVTPDPVEARQASFDGNEQTSGVVMTTASGFVVTSRFRERYNALVAIYGGDFVPALKPDHGIAPIGEDRWMISKEGMVHFLQMNTWRRAGLKPTN